MAKWRVAQIMPEGDGFRQVFVQPERPRYCAADLGYFQDMGEPRPIVVTFRADKDLCFRAQAAKGFGVQDPITIALIGRPQGTLLLVVATAFRFCCALRIPRQVFFFPPQRAFPDIHRLPPHQANQKEPTLC